MLVLLQMAKRIIKLCCAVSEKINSDQDVGSLLKLVFVPGADPAFIPAACSPLLWPAAC